MGGISGPTKHDLLYNPRFAVANFADIAGRWTTDSERVRARRKCYLDVPYGTQPSECMDIFRAEGDSKGTLVFIHGGYWRAQDKSGYSFLAENLVKAGVTVAIPNYSLCPNVEVRDIVMQMVQACAWLFRNASNFGAPRNRLIVSGHSAGGHLTAMMLACVWPAFAADLPPDLVKAGLSISGIFDAREVVKAPSINGDVRLTRKSAEVVSPVLMPPASEAPLYLAVGGKETGGFHFQHNLIKKKWGKVIAEDVPCPDDNHFTILDQFASTESDLFQATLRMLNR